IGTAVGAAMAGMRPVVELMYFDFIGVCLDQLMNQAAKLRFMTGGAVELPLVVRTQFGAGKSSGSQHSQSLEALLAHIPGLTVVMPSTPADTYGLLRAAIRDPNPVVFVENRLMYGRKGPKPPEDHLVPLGRAAVRREGTDVTLVSYSRLMHDCATVAEELAADGISVELIDLRTIAPLDVDTVLRSLEKTNRLVIAHQAVGEFGVGAELAAIASREGFWSLDAPVIRVGAQSTPAPYAPSLEQAWMPTPERIAAAVRESVRACGSAGGAVASPATSPRTAVPGLPRRAFPDRSRRNPGYGIRRSASRSTAATRTRHPTVHPAAPTDTCGCACSEIAASPAGDPSSGMRPTPSPRSAGS